MYVSTWLLACVAVVNAAVYSVPTNQNEEKAYWMEMAQKTLRDAISRIDNNKVAKNVILMLGDGLGVSTATAARIYKGQKLGQPGEETHLGFEDFPHVALSKTYNTDKQTADSAGTATAFLCGVKANHGTLGVDSRVARYNCTNMHNPDVLVKSIASWSNDAGKSVGLVTNTRITHATPGAAYAHTPNRYWETASDIPADCAHVKDIAYQLVMNSSYIHVVLGGGKRAFFNRADNLNLTDEWLADKQTRGVKAHYVDNAADFRAVDPANTDYLLGLFANSHMNYEVDRNNSQQPSLPEMTRKAIEILSKNEKGFFLMVEGGRIDHGHHSNLAKKALEETVVFEDAVMTAKQMTGDDTLIVVTADHSHVFNIAGYPKRGNDILGVVDDVPDWGIPRDKLPYTTLVYANGPGPTRQEENLTNVDTTTKDYVFQVAVPMQYDGETHGGEDVAIYATGPMAHLFHGVHEQNYIAHVMGYASCVGPNTDHCKPRPTLPPSDCDPTGGVGTPPRTTTAMVGVLAIAVVVMVMVEAGCAPINAWL